MKRLLVLLLTLTLAFSLVACSSGENDVEGGNTGAGNSTGSDADVTASGHSDDAYTIEVNGVTYTTTLNPADVRVACVVYQQDAHQSIIRQATIDCAEAYGVTIMSSVTNSDVAKDLELLNTYISQQFQGLIWAPYSTALIPVLREAKDGGAIVTIVNGIAESGDQPEQYFDGCYYNDNLSMCNTLGEVVQPHLETVFADNIESGEPIKVGIIAFDALSKEVSDIRVNAVLDQLDALGIAYEVVGRQDAVEQDKAIEVSGDMLTATPDLDLFVSCCESASIGAIMTISNEGLEGQCYVAGIDVSVQIAKLMQEYPEVGLAFVGQSSYEGGWRAAEQCIQLILGIGDQTNEAERGKINFTTDAILDSADPNGIQTYIDEMAALGVTG